MKTKSYFVDTAVNLEATKTVPQLRGIYAAARKRSKMSNAEFEAEIWAYKNVLDGRCPDGCCGNEDAPYWRLTPGLWAALAVDVADRVTSRG